MKAKNIIFTIAVVLVWAGTGLAADTDSNDERPYIGVMLDGAPLPDLLAKHLGLAPGQGIRVANIHRGSPADKAGLERDDIVIGFEGGDVDDRQQFVDNVRKAGIGTEVSLEIIHLGKRRTVTLKLEGLKGNFDLKYPPEPEIVQSWRPGKIFKLKPGDEMFDAIKKQMKELQQRLDKLEKRQKNMLESEEPGEPKKQQQKDSPPFDKGNEQRA